SRIIQVSATHAAFAPWLRARPSVRTIFRGHIRVHCRYGPENVRLPPETLSLGFRVLRTRHHATQPRRLYLFPRLGYVLLNMRAFTGRTAKQLCARRSSVLGGPRTLWHDPSV